MRRTTLLLTLLLFGCTTKSPTPPAGTVTAFEPYDLPDFTLTERTGKPVTKADLAGKVWVAAFVFTKCHGPCPVVTSNMAKLQAELLPTRPDVRLVTFTVDPVRDTPAVLKTYADNFRADPAKWLFLTGSETDVKAILGGGFKVGVVAKKDAKPGDEFDHSTKLAVVDKAGRVCGLFDGIKRDWDKDGSLFAEDMAKLTALVDRLAKGP